MKILQVIDQLGLGGAERVCVNMANLLYREGYDVKLIVFDRSRFYNFFNFFWV